ncbi:hypothetical protein [Legionella jamestowniensis]|uniref:Coiled-coil protein n=1 Tax=Legionella jamestowniensis TaxID=455 RepID=A0A0W0UK78_9GAMM|nr:hypothetical protein [Legionella jamestowniensis]KTD08321.1 coiled-coil protein [Legionella jamestowniensis]OCH97153.1 hypothetical protein A8135_05875 [Legionella jamestowniensis]SFL49719.1 hypothetical protein SAMN02746073_0453 [Legionella jamestowniensis DSM 19215]
MGKNNANSRAVNGNKPPYSNQGKKPSNQDKQRFFNQGPKVPIAKMQSQEVQQPIQQIKLETTTDFLLVAILEELKTRNMIEIAKLKAKQEQKQKELAAGKKMEELNNARFEEIRPSLYL